MDTEIVAALILGGTTIVGGLLKLRSDTKQLRSTTEKLRAALGTTASGTDVVGMLTQILNGQAGQDRRLARLEKGQVVHERRLRRVEEHLELGDDGDSAA